jgi:hypothetical protein
MPPKTTPTVHARAVLALSKTWARTCTGAGDHHGAAEQGQPAGQRTGHPQAHGHAAHGGQDTRCQRTQQTFQQGRHQGRVTPHRAGPDELQPAGLLLGAGRPDDRETGHHPGEHGGESTRPPEREAALGVDVEDRAEQRLHRRVGGQRSQRDAGVGAGRDELVVLRGGQHRHRRQRDRPAHPEQPVAPQPGAQAQAGAGEGAHRATSASGSE